MKFKCVELYYLITPELYFFSIKPDPTRVLWKIILHFTQNQKSLPGNKTEYVLHQAGIVYPEFR